MTRRDWGYTAWLAACLLLLTVSCVKNYNDGRAVNGDGSPVGPSTLPKSHVIEFHVLGTVDRALVSYGTERVGTTDVDTRLPWVGQVKTTQATSFVFITATPADFGTLRVQVFVDGSLFREAGLDDSFLLEPVTISGQVDLTAFPLKR